MATGNWSVCLYSLPVCHWGLCVFTTDLNEKCMKGNKQWQKTWNHNQEARSQENRHTAAFNTNFNGKKRGVPRLMPPPPSVIFIEDPSAGHPATCWGLCWVGIIKKLRILLCKCIKAVRPGMETLGVLFEKENQWEQCLSFRHDQGRLWAICQLPKCL